LRASIAVLLLVVAFRRSDEREASEGTRLVLAALRGAATDGEPSQTVRFARP